MLKADRDKLMNNLTQEEHRQFRSLIQQIRDRRKKLGGDRITARQVLESEGNVFPDSIRRALEGVTARDEMGPKVGEVPPDFLLKLMGSDERVRLSSFKGSRPVALVFGSYT